MADPIRSKLVVSYEMDYAKGYPEIRWLQNRQPTIDELVTFHSQLEVRSFRVANILSQVEDQTMAQNIQVAEKPKLVVASANGTNGG